MVHVEDVLLVVDTQTLLEQITAPSQDANNPTEVSDPGLCFLAASPRPGGHGRATAFLDIDLCDGGAMAKHGGAVGALHSIRWRALSLTGACDSTAILYGIAAAGQGAAVLNATRAIERLSQMPLPDLVCGESSDPPGFTAAEFCDYYLESLVCGRGSTPFAFSFYVTCTDDVGKPALAGYFRWWGTISVS